MAGKLPRGWISARSYGRFTAVVLAVWIVKAAAQSKISSE
jgi:hypothetical protein